MSNKDEGFLKTLDEKMISIQRPLTGVLGYLDLMRTGSIEGNKKTIANMESAVMHIIGTVNSVKEEIQKQLQP